MRLTSGTFVVAAIVLMSSCAFSDPAFYDPGSYGLEEGEHETLVAGVSAAESVLRAEFDDLFDEYVITAESVRVTRCEPFDSVEAAFSLRIVVAGLSSSAAYLRLIEGRDGVNEVAIAGDPGRSAGFELDGIGGRIVVSEEEGEDLRTSANTGCYEPDSWGVDDPYSLEFTRP